jgi:hypothetical protein
VRRLLQLIRFVRVALAARTIQDYLWGGAPGASCRPEGFEKYLDACQKRIECLRVLDRTKRSWKIEARKRLLQLSTVAVSAMEFLDGGCE